jgi:hypothetical protein
MVRRGPNTDRTYCQQIRRRRPHPVVADPILYLVSADPVWGGRQEKGSTLWRLTVPLFSRSGRIRLRLYTAGWGNCTYFQQIRPGKYSRFCWLTPVLDDGLQVWQLGEAWDQTNGFLIEKKNVDRLLYQLFPSVTTTTSALEIGVFEPHIRAFTGGTLFLGTNQSQR